MRSIRLSLLALTVLAALPAVGCSSRAVKPAQPSAQLSFGVQMARRGLWNEAFFRFQQAARLDPNNPHVINNLAVASEARGDFDGAQRYYQEALRISASDAEVKRNYARFVEFYQSYKSKEAGTAAAPAQVQEKSKKGDG
jgi:Flp pilus assembly protein TadD